MTETRKRAVYIVQHYYERTQTQTNVDQYQFLGKKRDDTESLVYEVGGFQNNTGQLQQIHDYEVHSDGKFDEIY
ncbi:hypothetical protein [Loigolactobacillus backii]|uniref:hypothetical protein n=1 Tax=Loigolactobacillus backii TaxID=375175 RepID=UPI0011799602|nr:hypothetical protein [Loigolactobacillus backii]